MNVCPLSYEPCEGRYSPKGLRQLSPRLTHLKDLPLNAAEQLQLAAAHADKLSIQGVQPKLSAKFSLKHESFVVATRGGTYILKPPNPHYSGLPENEDLTMRLAKAAKIDVPLHGLIYASDGSMTYFIKRFDRFKGGKLALEDFAQLSGASRETKYASSMEKVASIIQQFCTFPKVESVRLLRLTLFNFLVGNEDMHLKNFSLITRADRVLLSPAYDLLNTTIAIQNPVEETALPLGGKKRKLNQELLIDYFAKNRLDLTDAVISRVESDFRNASPRWGQLITRSFLPVEMKERYRQLITERWRRLFPKDTTVPNL